jgi:metal-dependent hydrolase (beta-lactamase superfamily II)
VRDKGLVVVISCGHTGVINIPRHAQALTGVSAIQAVVGSMHLNGPVDLPKAVWSLRSSRSGLHHRLEMNRRHTSTGSP